MRILLIHQIFVTPDEGGGTRHYEMCRHLVRSGHELVVIASEIDYLTGKNRGKKSEVKDGIQIYYAKADSDVHKSIIHRALNFFSFAYHAYKLAGTLGGFDLVWGTSPPLFQGWSAAKTAQKQKIPFVFEVRDLWIDFARELKVITNPLILKFFKIVEKRIYKSADHLVVNSPGFVAHIQKIVGERPVSVFPNGVEISDFEKTDNSVTNSFIAEFGLQDHFVVMYAGNIGVANDIETILDAASQLHKTAPKIMFTFLGGGLNAEKYKQRALDLGLNNVKFIPSQPKKNIPFILRCADVCLATLKPIPLFKTNYPNKVFDYMAAGKPTVCAIDGVTRKVVENANGGVFSQPGNSAQLAQLILDYYKNPELIKLHGMNAQKYVRENFDRKKITQQFADYLTGTVCKIQ